MQSYSLLCPVPCEHMESALETCLREGKVAFGSQLQEMFDDHKKPQGREQRIPAGTRVLICVSRSGDAGQAAAKYYKGDCVSYEGTYVQWQRAGNEKRNDGKHPLPRFRPASTLETDTAFMGFWEVSDLQKLTPQVPLSKLFVFNTKAKVSQVPRYPIYVDDKAV